MFKEVVYKKKQHSNKKIFNNNDFLTLEDYPLYNKYYQLTKDKFEQLVQEHKPVFITYVPEKIKRKDTIDKYNNNYLFIKEEWNKNEELNNITDYFSEIVRIQCNFKNNISPFEYWKNNKYWIENKLGNKKNNIKEYRDFMYKHIKFCNNFRVSVALTIYKMFNAKKILDPSAGWGDRLIAAIASNADLYIGVDPNDKLQIHYDNIINTLVEPKKRNNFKIINDGFEYADIPNEDYDLVFTSPPFFDLETYSSSKKDSYVAYPTAESWYNNFLLVMLNKSYKNLIIGGHLVLYIAESTDTNYINRMIDYLNTLMKSNGSFYYYYEDSYIPRRIFVWKKIN
jgi:hypothetical protein